jgi:hypothetical protein
MDWLTDSQPTKTTTTEKRPLHHVEEHHIEEEIDDDEHRSPSPQLNTRRESNTYGSNDFEEHDNETDNSEQ